MNLLLDTHVGLWGLTADPCSMMTCLIVFAMIHISFSVRCGLSNQELVAGLALSEATVKTHVTRILGKLYLRDRAQAVVLVYETGLVLGQFLPDPRIRE